MVRVLRVLHDMISELFNQFAPTERQLDAYGYGDIFSPNEGFLSKLLHRILSVLVAILVIGAVVGFLYFIILEIIKGHS